MSANHRHHKKTGVSSGDENSKLNLSRLSMRQHQPGVCLDRFVTIQIHTFSTKTHKFFQNLLEPESRALTCQVQRRTLNSHFAPENMPGPKRKLVFQASIFRCEHVSFREGNNTDVLVRKQIFLPGCLMM